MMPTVPLYLVAGIINAVVSGMYRREMLEESM